MRRLNLINIQTTLPALFFQEKSQGIGRFPFPGSSRGAAGREQREGWELWMGGLVAIFQAGAGHALAQAAVLEEILFQTAELLVNQTECSNPLPAPKQS